MTIISSSSPSTASVNDTNVSANQRAQKAKKPGPAAPKDELLLGAMAPAAIANQETLDRLRQAGDQVWDLSATANGFGTLVTAWGDAAPQAKAAPFLGTRVTALDAETPNLVTLLTPEDIVSDKGATHKAWDAFVTKSIAPPDAKKLTLTQAQHDAIAPMLGRISAYLSGDTETPQVLVDANAPGAPSTGVVTDRAISAVDDGSQGGQGQSDEPPEDDHIIAEFPSLIGKISPLAGLSIEEMAQVVMMKCADDSSGDVRNIIRDLQTNNAQKKVAREKVSDQKAQAAIIEKELRAAYDARTKLKEDDPARIVDSPTFDEYKASQLIVETTVNGQPRYSVSENTVLYPQPPKKNYDDAGQLIPAPWNDEAKLLNVTPKNIAKLHAFFSDAANAVTVGKFVSFQEWVLSPASVGGAGLSLKSTTSQDGLIDAARKVPAADIITAKLDRTPALTADVATLSSPVDHSIKQPPKKTIAGEMTVAMLDAKITGYQGDYDTLGDLGQEQAIRLQEYQQRYQKVMEALSNILKAVTDNANNIIGNIKT